MSNSTAPSANTSEAVRFYIEEDEHAHAGDGHDDGHDGGTALGFWIYLMSDCLIFAILFATYAVIGRNYAAGPSPADLFDLRLILVSTFMLLFSSITYGFSMLAMEKNNLKGTMVWLAATFLFGAAFLCLEFYEFYHLFHEGATPQRSGFLSAFFALVGTHGLHVAFGLIWMAVLMVQLKMRGLIGANKRRLMCLSMFWHFLDVIWIGVFSVVYLMGVIG